MAHYAFLDENNVVVEVIVGVDENDLIEGLTPEEWYGNFRNKKCVRTSYNHNIRKQFAGVGFIYLENDDVFINPRPFESWTLDDNFDWQPPKLKPNGSNWDWSENLGDWVELETE